jgi:hypothetical protein
VDIRSRANTIMGLDFEHMMKAMLFLKVKGFFLKIGVSNKSLYSQVPRIMFKKLKKLIILLNLSLKNQNTHLYNL